MDYFEKDLEIPFLKVLSENEGGLLMKDIKKILLTRLDPSGTCVEQSKSRGREINLVQRIGNFTLLRARRIFVKGYATYDKRTWIYKITEKGKKFLSENEEAHQSLISQGFTRQQREKEVDKDYWGMVIEEGVLKIKNTKQRKRSNRLRRYTIDRLKKSNLLKCEVCGFDFEEVYKELGKGFIEIHHKEPVSEMDIRGIAIGIASAMKKLSPVCSNCHRMIHRKKSEMVSIEDLKKLIE